MREGASYRMVYKSGKSPIASLVVVFITLKISLNSYKVQSTYSDFNTDDTIAVCLFNGTEFFPRRTGRNACNLHMKASCKYAMICVIRESCNVRTRRVSTAKTSWSWTCLLSFSNKISFIATVLFTSLISGIVSK